MNNLKCYLNTCLRFHVVDATNKCSSSQHDRWASSLSDESFIGSTNYIAP